MPYIPCQQPLKIMTDEAYLVGVHRYSFKSGKPAKIVGVEFVTPEKGEPRLCYHVVWADKTEDWIPVKDNSNYKIISFEQILAGDIPSVTK